MYTGTWKSIVMNSQVSGVFFNTISSVVKWTVDN